MKEHKIDLLKNKNYILSTFLINEKLINEHITILQYVESDRSEMLSSLLKEFKKMALSEVPYLMTKYEILTNRDEDLDKISMKNSPVFVFLTIYYSNNLPIMISHIDVDSLDFIQSILKKNEKQNSSEKKESLIIVNKFPLVDHENTNFYIYFPTICLLDLNKIKNAKGKEPFMEYIDEKFGQVIFYFSFFLMKYKKQNSNGDISRTLYIDFSQALPLKDTRKYILIFRIIAASFNFVEIIWMMQDGVMVDTIHDVYLRIRKLEPMTLTSWFKNPPSQEELEKYILE